MLKLSFQKVFELVQLIKKNHCNRNFFIKRFLVLRISIGKSNIAHTLIYMFLCHLISFNGHLQGKLKYVQNFSKKAPEKAQKYHKKKNSIII